jgi:hypothetical protein
MIKTLKVFFLVATSFLLASCATQQYYAATINTWQGANQEQVYRTWGYPNKIRKLPNGNKLLIYREREQGSEPVFAIPGTTTVEQGRRGHTRVVTTQGTISGGGSYDLRCTTWFELNKKGRVVNTSFRGNNCVATKQFMMNHTYQGF